MASSSSFSSSTSATYWAVVIILVCVEVLAILPEGVSAVRRADLVRGNEHPVPRSLIVTSVPELVKTKQNFPHAPPVEFFDPNQSDKRRVPKGSDPIHNRS